MLCCFAMTDTLADICAAKRKHIKTRKAEMPESALREKLREAMQARRTVSNERLLNKRQAKGNSA